MGRSSKLKTISVNQCHLWLVLIIWLIFGIKSLIAQEKPNLIFIMADDLGYGDVGYNGQKHILTPRIDQMAE